VAVFKQPADSTWCK